MERKDFDASGLEWDTLEEIYSDYYELWPAMGPAAAFFMNTLAMQPGVHGVRYRVKDPEHLVEKVIRRSKDKGAPCAGAQNYLDKIKDLIGVRALHVFKEDWRTVDRSIRENWELSRRPEAKVRRDIDPEQIINEFREKGCRIAYEESGYRSVHYEIETHVRKRRVFVELQVRTLFEEAWGEASHRTKYPYFQGSDTIEGYLTKLSQLCGLGDSIASAAKALRELGDASTDGSQAGLERVRETVAARLEHVKAALEVSKNDLFTKESSPATQGAQPSNRPASAPEP